MKHKSEMRAFVRKLYVIGFGLFYTVVTVVAQQCPTVQRAALGETYAWCGDVQLGEVCYGNSIANAEFASMNADSMSFDAPGDWVLASEVVSLTTSVGDHEYGVVQLRTTGSTGNSWQPHDITMVLFGDVTMTNMGQENVNVDVVTGTLNSVDGVNIRSGPTTEYRIITSLFDGDIIKGTGQLADGSWLRIQLPDGETGWVLSEVVDADTSDLPVVTYESPVPDLLYAPYAAFSLQTETLDAPCAEAWESGLLVQTPFEALARLRVNEQTLQVSGTVFLQADPDIALTVFVIEGTVELGDDQVEEGYKLVFPNEQPPITLPYDFDRMAYLPTEILPRYAYVGVELDTVITPAPEEDRSPIIDTLVTDPCVLTTGLDGANLRAGPNADFPIRGVLAYRETAHPIGRFVDGEGVVWWELLQNVWVNSVVVVTGGDCVGVPDSRRIPNALPTASP